MKKKFLSLFLSAALVFASTIAANATVFYGTSDYTTGSLGYVNKSTVTKDVLTNIGSQQLLYAYKNGSSEVIIEDDLDGYGTAGGDTLTFYNTSDFTKSLGQTKLSYSNAHGMAVSGTDLYVAFYGSDAKLVKYDISDPSKITETAVYAPEIYSGDGYAQHSEKVAIIGDYVYLLKGEVKGSYGTGYTYAESALYKLKKSDLTLVKKYDNMGKNATDMVVINNKLYIVAVGGSQGATQNTESKIICFDPSTETPTTCASIAGLLEKGTFSYNMFFGLATDGTNIYLLATGYDASWNTNYAIYKVAIADFKDNNIGEVFASKESCTGYTWGITYDTNESKLALEEGTALKLFASDGTPETFDSSALGNNISAMTIVKDITTPSGSGSSGGCNAGFGAFALLTLLPLAWKKRKH